MITSRQIFSAFIPGKPKGQPRPRAFVKKMASGGVRASVFEAGTAEQWKSSVATTCQTLEGRLLVLPLMVTLTFYFPRPKSHFTAKGVLRPLSPLIHRQTPDADNAAKAVLDALSHVGAWQDDNQISDLIIRKRWATGAPGCQIQIHELTENFL